MHKTRLYMTAIVLLFGIASASKTKSKHLATTFWTINGRVLPQPPSCPPCCGGSFLCAIEYTIADSPTGNVLFKDN